ncbi:MAG: thioesterase family protein [Sphingobacteriia bacterium]|jgi:predicted thioesterase
MKNPFQPGDRQVYQVVVGPADLASFQGQQVHPLYSTFALGRDAEWCCRLFVLQMLEEGEEGIGTYLSIEHLGPAPLGATVDICATLLSVSGSRIRCAYEARVGQRLIARGEQEQRILEKAIFEARLAELNPGRPR